SAACVFLPRGYAAMLRADAVPHEREHVFRDAIHLLALRTALEKHELAASLLERPQPLGDLLGHANEARAQTAIAHAVVLEAHLRHKLRALDKAELGREAARARLHVGDALDLALRLTLGVEHDSEAGDPKTERRQLRWIR